MLKTIATVLRRVMYAVKIHVLDSAPEISMSIVLFIGGRGGGGGGVNAFTAQAGG